MILARQDLLDRGGQRSIGQHRELHGVLEDGLIASVDTGSLVATGLIPHRVVGICI